MRIPKIENYEVTAPTKVINLGKVETVPMEISVVDDRQKSRTIAQIEKHVRSSLEYRQYIDYLKRNIDMNACSYFKGVNRSEGKKVSIEIHHEPFYLYDIAQIVLEKHIDQNRESLNIYEMSEEVMELHYQNKVGLIPISKTIHELVHSDKIFIPLQSIYGNYLAFVEEYDKYIPNDILAMLETKLTLSQSVESQDNSVIEKQYVYLEVDGMTFPQPIDVIVK